MDAFMLPYIAEKAENLYDYHCRRGAFWRSLAFFDRIAAWHDVRAEFYYFIWIAFRDLAAERKAENENITTHD